MSGAEIEVKPVPRARQMAKPNAMMAKPPIPQ
jgi:hypothetical protein